MSVPTAPGISRRSWRPEWVGDQPEKTRVVNLIEKQAHLDFLGYTFRYDRDWKGRGHRYLNIVPSKKALQRERNRLREMTGYSQSHKPLPRLIAELNRHLKGWGNYFSFGRQAAYGKVHTYVLQRLYRHGRRRSQRPYHSPRA